MTDKPINNLETESYDDRIFRLWANGTIQPRGNSPEKQQENYTMMVENYAKRNQ